MDRRKVDVFGIGFVVVDELALLPHFPHPDEKLEMVDHVEQVGGPVPTALRQLSRLGFATAFSGLVGDDAQGEFIRAGLGRDGVDTELVVSMPGCRSGFALAWASLEKGERAVASTNGSLPALAAGMLPEERFPECRLFHIDGREQRTVIDIVRRMKARGCLVSIDTGSFRPHTLELLPLVDYIIMPRRFADVWLGAQAPRDMGEAAEAAAARFPAARVVCVTDGKRGSAASADGRLCRQPAFPVETVDTTGCGDAHCGALLARLLAGDPLATALRYAAACAAIKASRLGNGTLADDGEIRTLAAAH
jgi:ribokinase